MKNLLLLTILCFLTLPASTYALEENNISTAEKKAQEAIEACWAISQEDRDSTSTARQRAGALNTALCMEEHIIELSETYLFPDSPDLLSETKKKLEETRFGYGRLYWNLYNYLDTCFKDTYGNPAPGCGTVFHSFHNFAYARLLEGLVLDCYKQIERYDLDSQN